MWCTWVLLLIVAALLLIIVRTHAALLVRLRCWPWLVACSGTPVADAYRSSYLLEQQQKRGESIELGGFERIAPLVGFEIIDPMLKIMQDEVSRFLAHSESAHERLGERLAVAGSKSSYQVRLMGVDTSYVSHFPRSLEIIDALAKSRGAACVAVSLAVMQPYTWLKFHEGFWGYAEFISRSIIGVFGPQQGSDLHVCGESPQPIRPGEVVTFDDCRMHEAYNVSSAVRVCLIVDLHRACDGGFKQGENVISDLEQSISTRELKTSEDEARRTISLDTINTVRHTLLT